MEQRRTQSSPTRKKKKNRSTGFSRLAKFLLVVIVIWWFNNLTLKTTKETITSDKVNNEIKIAVISDYHAYDGAFAIKSSTITKKIRKINPDIVCVLGDMHSNNATVVEKQISMELMTDIIADGYDLYFVLGEHDDRTNAYVAKMRKNKIKVLDKQSETIEIGDSKLTLYGISNAYFAPTFDLKNEFDEVDKENFTILMAHIPRYDDYEKFGTDLTLCGDTHGGIIQIPFLGPAYYDRHILPELYIDKDTIHDKGLFEYENGHMFITSGIGNSIDNKNCPVRFGNRPEIGVITILPD